MLKEQLSRNSVKVMKSAMIAQFLEGAVMLKITKDSSLRVKAAICSVGCLMLLAILFFLKFKRYRTKKVLRFLRSVSGTLVRRFTTLSEIRKNLFNRLVNSIVYIF